MIALCERLPVDLALDADLLEDWPTGFSPRRTSSRCCLRKRHATPARARRRDLRCAVPWRRGQRCRTSSAR
jgi:hypothetical protein